MTRHDRAMAQRAGLPAGAHADTATRVLGALIDAHALGESTGTPSLALRTGLPRGTVVDAIERLVADGLAAHASDGTGTRRGTLHPLVVVVARG